MYTPSQSTLVQLDRAFTYHPPKQDQVDRYQRLREQGKNLAEIIVTNCPPSEEQREALKMLSAAIMWANASIARNE